MISTFLKNSLRNTIRVSNSLDPGQAQRFVGPDLGPNCLQRFAADNISKRPRVKVYALCTDVQKSQMCRFLSSFL